MISGNNRKYRFLLTFALILIEITQSHGQCAAVINTFPYQESFESGTANWISGGISDDWTWGSPSKALINSAGAGSNCWIVGGTTTSFYNFGERSWLKSPCFDFTLIDKPYISFLVFWDTESYYDGGNIQYSLNGGGTWTTLGASIEPTECNLQNWYNENSILNLNTLANNRSGWSGNTDPIGSTGSCNGGNGIGRWVRASHCVPAAANKPQVIFRFTFGSGTTCNSYDGFAIDDFFVGTPPATAIDFSFNCNGNSNVDFSSSSSNCLNQYKWDFGDPASSLNSSTVQSNNHLFTSSGVFNVSLTASGACSSDTTVTKQVVILGAAISSTNVTCVGDSDGTASVTIQGAGPFTNVLWNTIPFQLTYSIMNLPEGNYSAVISDSLACGLTLNTSIIPGPFSKPNVDIGNDVRICPGEKIPLIAHNFSTYLWQDGSNDSVFVVTQEGKIVLIVTNEFGCQASDSLLVLEDCINDILFPNSFTPNQDGINEVFLGVGSEPSGFLLQIFNRWGEVIFESNSMAIGWDGRYQGRFVHDGIYIYQAKFTMSDNQEIVKTGNLFLVR